MMTQQLTDCETVPSGLLKIAEPESFRVPFLSIPEVEILQNTKCDRVVWQIDADRELVMEIRPRQALQR